MGNCCSDEMGGGGGHAGRHSVGPAAAAAAEAASAAADRFLRSRGAGASTQVEVRKTHTQRTHRLTPHPCGLILLHTIAVVVVVARRQVLASERAWVAVPLRRVRFGCVRRWRFSSFAPFCVSLVVCALQRRD